MKNSMKAAKHNVMGELNNKKKKRFFQLFLEIKYKSLFSRPYDNRWSKTMIGYGPESTHFVLELTYNYGVKSYELGKVESTEQLGRE